VENESKLAAEAFDYLLNIRKLSPQNHHTSRLHELHVKLKFMFPNDLRLNKSLKLYHGLIDLSVAVNNYRMWYDINMRDLGRKDKKKLSG